MAFCPSLASSPRCFVNPRPNPFSKTPPIISSFSTSSQALSVKPIQHQDLSSFITCYSDFAISCSDPSAFLLLFAISAAETTSTTDSTYPSSSSTPATSNGEIQSTFFLCLSLRSFTSISGTFSAAASSTPGAGSYSAPLSSSGVGSSSSATVSG